MMLVVAQKTLSNLGCRRVMITAVSLAVGLFLLGLLLAAIGYSSVEHLEIPSSPTTGRLALKPGKNRVETVSRGKTVVAELFLPVDYAPGEKRPAIVIAPPATAVKEQASQVYAEKLSRKGYITLAFDPRGIGESEGTQGNSNPYHFANDIAAWVSFLSSLEQVDSERLMNVGVCHGSVGVVFETFQDNRIKAMALVVPSIAGPEMTRGTLPPVRWILFVLGGVFNLLNLVGINVKTTAIPPEDKLDDNSDPGILEVATFYPKGKPGFHPRWINAISATSLSTVAKLYVFDYADRYSDIPVFMATGERGYSYEPAMRFYDQLDGPRERLVLAENNHVDFYYKDEPTTRAVDGIDAFFKRQLAL